MVRDKDSINDVLHSADIDIILESYSDITAWENEPHADKYTQAEFVVETEPHHHQHVPGEQRKKHSFIGSGI